MNIEIAIPSYNRPKIIGQKTLKLLLDFGVCSNQIRIFLRDKEQQKLYEQEIGTSWNFHITGQSGIDATRNYLRYYYHHTDLDAVLFMDDDITKFMDMDKPIDRPFMDLIQYFFKETKDRGARLFAVYPSINTYYMKDKITTSLRYCVGGFQGLIIDKTKPIIFCDVGHFEDHQFSYEHFIEDGCVVRFDRWGIETKYFERKGGICGDLGGMKNRQKEMEENAHYMVARYGDMCKINIKKNGYDLKVNHFYKN